MSEDVRDIDPLLKQFFRWCTLPGKISKDQTIFSRLESFIEDNQKSSADLLSLVSSYESEYNVKIDKR